MSIYTFFRAGAFMNAFADPKPLHRLAGQVLPVGGLKEKLLAAHRSGIKKCIVPAATRSDIEHNVPDSIKNHLEIVYVDNVRQVIENVFAGQEIATLAKELPLAEQSEVGTEFAQ